VGVEDVVERPPSPKPDYRTKPDYSVKFQDAVEINPIETRHEAAANMSSDEDGGEGEMGITSIPVETQHESVSSRSDEAELGRAAARAVNEDPRDFTPTPTTNQNSDADQEDERL